MRCFLALECSLTEGSLVLSEFDEKDLNHLYSTKWRSHFNGKFTENSHSDKLPLEIHQALKLANKKLSDLNFLAVGAGPGRWTGVRTATSVIRSLSFCLKIPICSVNSLRVSAESVLPFSSPVFTAVNGFKNQVYFAEFHSQKNTKDTIQLMDFPHWLRYMKKQTELWKEEKNPICLSDLEGFYPIPQSLKTAFSFKKIQPEAVNLAKIVFKQKKQRIYQNWSQLKAFYLRSPLK